MLWKQRIISPNATQCIFPSTFSQRFSAWRRCSSPQGCLGQSRRAGQIWEKIAKGLNVAPSSPLLQSIVFGTLVFFLKIYRCSVKFLLQQQSFHRAPIIKRLFKRSFFQRKLFRFLCTVYYTYLNSPFPSAAGASPRFPLFPASIILLSVSWSKDLRSDLPCSPAAPGRREDRAPQRLWGKRINRESKYF